ncbi:cytochrome P450 2J4-like [Dermacentor albipictus]|uniref:cytochrome P450 2J4-like n=1 Tax=Dermacentor albipictus TaxID=60249 RepID=UPI0031FC660B
MDISNLPSHILWTATQPLDSRKMACIASISAAILSTYYALQKCATGDLHGMFIYTIALAATILVAAFTWYSRRKCRGLCPKLQPPGPRGIPLLGNLEFNKRGFYHTKAMDWVRQYGPLFRFKMLAVNVVVVNDYDLIRDTFSKPEILHRPAAWLLKETTEGLAVLGGREWRENRRFVTQALVDLGYGKQTMWDRVQVEAQHLVGTIDKFGGAPILPRDLLFRSACNNVVTFLLGRRLDLDDPRRRDMDEHLEGFLLGSAASSIDCRPQWLKRLERWLCPRSPRVTVEDLANELEAMSKREVQRAMRMDVSQRNKAVIDIYNEKLEELGSGHDIFTEGRLVGNVTDYLLGATAVVALFLQSHVLNFAAHPDTLQEQVRQEIDRVVGRDRLPTWADHVRMPLTMATIWEMYRWKACTPFGIPRGVAEDTVIGGYHVPKGTVLLPNFWAVHQSTKLWKEPEKFDPSRFIGPDGSAPSTRPAHIITFSLGKRICPGESLATAEVFLYLTMLLQKFRILPEEGTTLQIGSYQPLYEHAATKIRFLPRSD